MSTTSARNENQQIEQLLDELRTQLEEVEFNTARIGPVERRGDGAAVTIELDVAEPAETTREPRPVTTTFEEDLEHYLEKNHELLRRLA